MRNRAVDPRNRVRSPGTLRVALATALAATLWIGVPSGQGGGRGQGRAGGPARDTVGQATLGTASISGTVVAEASGTPVRRAMVTLTGVGLRGGRSVVTDDLGQFFFAALPEGRFTMTASKPGYVNAAYGAKRAGRPGTPIQIVSGQSLERMVIALPRGGVITGRVVDDHGEPATGTQVRAFRYVMQTGERALQSAGQDQTDDRGIYRIYQLQPGDYVVNAIPRNMNSADMRQALASELANLVQQANELNTAGGGGNLAGLAGLAAGRGAGLLGRAAELQSQMEQVEGQQSVGYAPVYYPGTTAASAAGVVPLGASEERIGIDFQLRLVPTARITGSVVGTTGVLPQGTQVALIPSDWSAGVRGPGLNMTRVNQTGEFAFSNVTPGEYTVQARATVRESSADGAPARGRGGRGGPIVEVLWASTPVSISGQDLTDVVLNLQAGMKITGRVDFDGASAVPDDLSDVRVTLSSRGAQSFEIGGTPAAQVEASGRFTINGVSPGRYAISATVGGGGRGRGRGTAVGGQSGGWTLGSVIVNGQEALDFPIEVSPYQDIGGAVVTFTDRTQTLTGTIQDTSGRPTSDFTIIVFPSDSSYWLPQARRIASARPDTDGRFTFGSLPPGEYRLTAVTDAEPGEWYDPEFLAQLERVSISVSLVEGQTRTQNIRVAGG